MRIGLVCEGPSDIPAVEHFLYDQLAKLGIQPTFRNLFPDPDNTRPEGGWGNLFLWLARNPPQSRVVRFFQGGLFGGEGATEPLDAIVIQIDADIAEDDIFRRFALERFGVAIGECVDASARASAVSSIAELAADLNELTDVDRRRHVIAVAVESTEAWCVAAFHPQPKQVEELRGSDLTVAFMRALEISEARQPQDWYANCDKDIKRRKNYCQRFGGFSDRVVASCPHFAMAVDALVANTHP